MLHLFPKSVAHEEERSKVLSALTEKHARALAKIEDPQDRWSTAKLAIKSGLGVRELEKMCNKTNRHNGGEPSTSQTKEIQSIVYRMVEGFNSKDLSPFFSAMSTKHFSNFPLFPPFEKLEADMARDHFCNALGHIDELHERIQDLEVRVVGKFAYATMQVQSRLTVDGNHISSRSRATLIFEKENDEWKLVHSHWSSPIATQLPQLVVRTTKGI
jgi:ketosteroid isomerase-like protein